MKKKVNPRKRPATQADVEKAKKIAQGKAVTWAWAIIFSALRDKEGFGKKRLRRVWDEVNDISESITKGYINITDLIHTLEAEAGIVLE